MNKPISRKKTDPNATVGFDYTVTWKEIQFEHFEGIVIKWNFRSTRVLGNFNQNSVSNVKTCQQIQGNSLCNPSIIRRNICVFMYVNNHQTDIPLYDAYV